MSNGRDETMNPDHVSGILEVKRSTVSRYRYKLLTAHCSLLTVSQANEQNLSAQLRDIKPLMEIPDNSFYYYWGVIGFAAFLAAAILFFVLKKYWESRQENLRKKYLVELKKVDWKESKASAYRATHYARLLANDDRLKELYSQLEPMLEQYKYKKSVEEVDGETRNRFTLFVKVADESL